MSIIGSNWKQEPDNLEIFNEITGCQVYDKSELPKEIDWLLNNPYTPRTDRQKLLELKAKIQTEN